jgi:hypothetical protein
VWLVRHPVTDDPSPKVQLQETGETPPVIDVVNLTAVPTVGVGLALVVTDSLGLTVTDTVLITLTLRLSVAVTVALNVPLVV